MASSNESTRPDTTSPTTEESAQTVALVREQLTAVNRMVNSISFSPTEDSFETTMSPVIAMLSDIEASLDKVVNTQNTLLTRFGSVEASLSELQLADRDNLRAFEMERCMTEINETFADLELRLHRVEATQGSSRSTESIQFSNSPPENELRIRDQPSTVLKSGVICESPENMKAATKTKSDSGAPLNTATEQPVDRPVSVEHTFPNEVLTLSSMVEKFVQQYLTLDYDPHHTEFSNAAMKVTGTLLPVFSLMKPRYRELFCCGIISRILDEEVSVKNVLHDFDNSLTRQYVARHKAIHKHSRDQPEDVTGRTKNAADLAHTFNTVVRKQPGFNAYVKAYIFPTRDQVMEVVNSMIPVSQSLPATVAMWDIASLALKIAIGACREPVEYSSSYPKHDDLVQYKQMIVRAMDHPLPELPLAVRFSAFPCVTKHTFEQGSVSEIVLQKAHVVAIHKHVRRSSNSSAKEITPVTSRRGETVPVTKREHQDQSEQTKAV